MSMTTEQLKINDSVRPFIHLESSLPSNDTSSVDADIDNHSMGNCSNINNSVIAFSDTEEGLYNTLQDSQRQNNLEHSVSGRTTYIETIEDLSSSGHNNRSDDDINNNNNNDKNDPNRNSGTDRSQTRREMSRLEYEVDLIRAENERLRMQNTNLLEQNVKLRSEKHVHPQLKNNTGPLRNHHHQNNATKMTAPLENLNNRNIIKQEKDDSYSKKSESTNNNSSIKSSLDDSITIGEDRMAKLKKEMLMELEKKIDRKLSDKLVSSSDIKSKVVMNDIEHKLSDLEHKLEKVLKAVTSGGLPPLQQQGPGGISQLQLPPPASIVAAPLPKSRSMRTVNRTPSVMSGTTTISEDSFSSMIAVASVTRQSTTSSVNGGNNGMVVTTKEQVYFKQEQRVMKNTKDETETNYNNDSSTVDAAPTVSQPVIKSTQNENMMTTTVIKTFKIKEDSSLPVPLKFKQFKNLKLNNILKLHQSYVNDLCVCGMVSKTTEKNKQNNNSNNNNNIKPSLKKMLERQPTITSTESTASINNSKSPPGDTSKKIHERLVATASYDNTIRITSLKNQKLLATLKGHTSGVFCLTPIEHKETPLLASGSRDETIKLWNLIDFSLVFTIKCGFSVWSISVCYYHYYYCYHHANNGAQQTPSNSHNIKKQKKKIITESQPILIAGYHTGKIELWNVITQQKVASLEGHTGGIFALEVFQYNHRNSSSNDSRSATTLGSGRSSFTSGASFSDSMSMLERNKNDNKLYLASASDDKQVKIWSIEDYCDSSDASSSSNESSVVTQTHPSNPQKTYQSKNINQNYIQMNVKKKKKYRLVTTLPDEDCQNAIRSLCVFQNPETNELYIACGEGYRYTGTSSYNIKLWRLIITSNPENSNALTNDIVTTNVSGSSSSNTTNAVNTSASSTRITAFLVHTFEGHTDTVRSMKAIRKQSLPSNITNNEIENNSTNNDNNNNNTQNNTSGEIMLVSCSRDGTLCFWKLGSIGASSSPIIGSAMKNSPSEVNTTTKNTDTNDGDNQKIIQKSVSAPVVGTNNNDKRRFKLQRSLTASRNIFSTSMKTIHSNEDLEDYSNSEFGLAYTIKHEQGLESLDIYSEPTSQADNNFYGGDDLIIAGDYNGGVLFWTSISSSLSFHTKDAMTNMSTLTPSIDGRLVKGGNRRNFFDKIGRAKSHANIHQRQRRSSLNMNHTPKSSLSQTQSSSISKSQHSKTSSSCWPSSNKSSLKKTGRKSVSARW